MIKLSELVIKAIKKRGDNFDIHKDKEIMADKTGLLEYTSSDHISVNLKRKNNGKPQELLSTKRTKRTNA